MASLIQQVREVSMLMGSPQKTIQECEKAGELVIRRSIVAKRDMKKSEIITWEDI